MQQQTETVLETVFIRPVYLAPQFCAEFGVSLTTMRFEIANGRLKAFKIGAKLAVAGEDALAWRDAHRAKGVSFALSPDRVRTGKRKLSKAAQAALAGEPAPA